MLKFLIVGAGFSGATLARCLAEKGHNVDVIEKRDHVAGNAFDYIDDTTGIRVHKYGPHIFHTNNDDVVEFLSRFTSWTPYKHKVKAQVKVDSLPGFTARHEYVTMPPNKKTKQILEEYGLDMIETLYRPYTEKMWGYKLEDIDPSITDRVKPRDDDNEYYFPNDKFQALPTAGYTELVYNMLNHENITLKLKTPFHISMEENYDHVFNSMPIDEYYKEIFGALEYRGINFSLANMSYSSATAENVAVINYTSKDGPTRTTNYGKFPNSIKGDFFMSEYPGSTDYLEGSLNAEKMYPVKDLKGMNKKRYDRYKAIPNEKVTFIGRLGNYVYIDMHQAVNMSLQLAKKIPPA